MLRRTRQSRTCWVCSALLTLCNSSLAGAAEKVWLHCAPISPPAGMSSPLMLKQSVNDTVKFTADQVRIEDQRYYLRGQVVGRQYNQELMAEEVDYDAHADYLHAEGNIRYQSDTRIVSGDSAEFELGQHSGEISPAQFWLTDMHLRGDADKVQLDGPAITRVSAVRFTTCDLGSNDWYLQASRLELNTETGVGVAHNARITFMHVPIFYTPYISFPLDDRRKTGFLVPSIEVDANSGTELTIPYYWNIAPQRDDTFTPHFITERGVLLENEFRYLNERSQGQLQTSYLGNDNLYGDSRAWVDYQHKGEPASGWRTSFEYRYASDEDYLNDFGDSLDTSSVTHLERRADVEYRATDWSSSFHLQGYQTLDESIAPTSRPYNRLPQVLWRLHERDGANGLRYGIRSELVHFDRDAGVVGTRLDLQPRVAWPWRGNAGFLEPALKYRYTTYLLDNLASSADASPSRSLPIFSIDSGLYFERSLDPGSRARLQTLEPRLFYLYVPYRNQEQLIVDESNASQVFDSSLPGFGMDQLFRDNRFNGADRVGDANQLSMALTTRYLDARGAELLSASLGRILYFRDREVTMPGGSVETDASSDWVAALKSQWSTALSSRANLVWDSIDNHLTQGNVDLRYVEDHNHALRVGYRYTRDETRQLDLAGMWPVASQWNLVARWLHSLRDHSTLETLAGVEYESCCWNLRLVQQRYRVNVSDEEFKSSIWLQLELKGLTSVGKKVNDLLARDILAP